MKSGVGVSPSIKEKQPGKIITFYSYKGGTGRSMALANVAWILASNGKRVLAIDWDLEAPGLHRYFTPFLIDDTLKHTDGLINFVNEYKVKMMTPPPAGKRLPKDWYVPFADLSHYAVSLEWDFPNGGCLDFIPAGRQDEAYSALVNSFSWKDFYLDLGGSYFLEKAKEKLCQDYDYVLIDSRTGVSDTSGICTVKMPDTLVVCFTLNNQGIEGAANVANDVYSQRLKSQQPLQIFPVPMRVENAETEKRDNRMAYAKNKFGSVPSCEASSERYWGEIPVIYIPYYAYEEILAAFGEQTSTKISLLASAEQLTGFLTGGKVSRLVPPTEAQRKEVLAQYSGYSAAADNTQELIKHLDTMVLGLSDREQQIAKRVLLRLVSVARPDEVVGDTRQRVSLASLSPVDREMALTLNKYCLVEIDRDSSDTDATVQLVKEEMVRSWRRLQDWINADRDFLQWRQELHAGVNRWNRNARDEGDLLRGHDLNTADANLSARPEDLSLEETQFIQASLAQRKFRHDRKKLVDERPNGAFSRILGTATKNLKSLGRFLVLVAVRESTPLLLAIVSLIFAAYFGYGYWSRLNRFSDITSDMLNANFEETPQAFKGIEAFILGKVSSGMTNDLDRARFTKEFVRLSEELRKEIDDFNADNITKPPTDLHVAPGENGGKILTDTSTNGDFLFLPVPILRPVLDQTELDKLESNDPQQQKEAIDLAIRSDANLWKDIAFTKALSNTLGKFTKTPIVENITGGVSESTYKLNPIPAQVYVITKNGINRIFSHYEPDYYGSQFSPTTFFPSRPYYLAAFRNSNNANFSRTYGNANEIVPYDNERPGDYFYISRPYMDLGGNGIVVTLARGIVIKGVQGVICFDLPFENGIGSLIQPRVADLDGISLYVNCSTLSSREVQCNPKEPSHTPSSVEAELIGSLKNRLEEKIREGNRADVFGNIQDITNPITKIFTHELNISIPIGPGRFKPMGRKSETVGFTDAQFLLANLDLVAYKDKTQRLAYSSTGCVGVMCLLLAYSLISAKRHEREYQEALSRVGKIMVESPTPYLRLDDEDRIVDVNPAFCIKLGYPPDNLSLDELKQYTLQSLCDDVRSYNTYERVQELRRNNKEVLPYYLNLRSRDGYPVTFRVVSAGIPAAQRGDLPETFGIFLTDENASPHQGASEKSV